METIRVQIKGGAHDGEVYVVPKDMHLPEVTNSLTENEINLVGLLFNLRQLETVFTILEGDPLASVEEIEERPPWKA